MYKKDVIIYHLLQGSYNAKIIASLSLSTTRKNETATKNKNKKRKKNKNKSGEKDARARRHLAYPDRRPYTRGHDSPTRPPAPPGCPRCPRVLLAKDSTRTTRRYSPPLGLLSG